MNVFGLNLGGAVGFNSDCMVASESFFSDNSFGMPDHGYSMNRQLNGDYTGNIIGIRRVSDNEEVDVDRDSNNLISLDSPISGGTTNATNLGEFTAAPGYTDADSLGAADDAAITTVYDQFGSVNFIRTVGSEQALLVDGGVLQTINDNVKCQFDGTDDFLESSTTMDIAGTGDCLIVYVMGTLDGVPNTLRAFDSLTNPTQRILLDGNADGSLRFAAGNIGAGNVTGGTGVLSASTDYLVVFGVDGTTIFCELNGTGATTATKGTVDAPTTHYLGAENGNGGGSGWADANGRLYWKELLIYTSHTDDQNSIRDAVNDYYSIY